MKVLWCVWILSLLVTTASALPPLVELRDAAERGDVKAQKTLADKYAGQFNFTETEKWYRRAASTGDPEALLKLGHVYITGKPQFNGTAPVAKNVTNAMTLYTLAALQGHPESQYAIALHHWEGKLVKQDKLKAYQFLRLSERYLASKLLLDQIILKLPRDEIDRGEKMAREFKQISFKEGLRATAIQNLSLQGVMVLKTHKTAMINGKTVSEGKSFDIDVAGFSGTVRCDRIEERAVTVTLNRRPGVVRLQTPVTPRNAR